MRNRHNTAKSHALSSNSWNLKDPVKKSSLVNKSKITFEEQKTDSNQSKELHEYYDISNELESAILMSLLLRRSEQTCVNTNMGTREMNSKPATNETVNSLNQSEYQHQNETKAAKLYASQMIVAEPHTLEKLDVMESMRIEDQKRRTHLSDDLKAS